MADNNVSSAGLWASQPDFTEPPMPVDGGGRAGTIEWMTTRLR